MSFNGRLLRAARFIPILAVLLALTGPAWAAPLDPVITHIDAGIGGRAMVMTQPPTRPESTYSATIRSDRFTDGGVELRNATAVGPAPGFDHTALVNSTAGARFEQIAENEYVLTLSTAAGGEVRRGTMPSFLKSDVDGNAHMNVSAQFMVLGYAGQTKGTPAAVYLELEHFGTLSSVNNGMGSAMAELHLTAGGPNAFHYSNRLDIPQLPSGSFQETEFVGTRDYSTQYAFFTSVGQMITLSAMLDSHAWMYLDPGMPYARRASDSDFMSGLRLHMTVLPEPSVLCLLLAGTLLCTRRRTSASSTAAQ